MTTSQPHDTRLRRRRNPPGHHAREHPRSNYEQPPHAVTLDLRERALTTKHGPAVPTREYESDRASRTRQARRPLSRAPQTRGSPKPQPSRLTTVPPYELAMVTTGRSNLNPSRLSVLLQGRRRWRRSPASCLWPGGAGSRSSAWWKFLVPSLIACAIGRRPKFSSSARDRYGPVATRGPRLRGPWARRVSAPPSVLR